MPELRPLPEATDAGETKCLADVAKIGWHVVHVLEDDSTPGWSFTVGLARAHGHPELVVFGVPREIAHDALNSIGLRVRAGAKFLDGAAIPDVLDGFELAVRNVAVPWYKPFLGMAVWFHQGDDFDAVQLFWPDKAGTWPWSPNASAGFKAEQPLLYEGDPIRARVEALLASMDDDT